MLGEVVNWLRTLHFFSVRYNKARAQKKGGNMVRWSFLPNDDPYRGPPSVGFLQVQGGQPYQVWLTWDSWNFAWVAFLKVPEQARSLIDALAVRLEDMSRDTSDQGLRRLADYLAQYARSCNQVQMNGSCGLKNFSVASFRLSYDQLPGMFEQKR